MILDEAKGRSLAMHGLSGFSTGTDWKQVTGEEEIPAGICWQDASRERKEFHERKKPKDHQPGMTTAERQWQWVVSRVRRGMATMAKFR